VVSGLRHNRTEATIAEVSRALERRRSWLDGDLAQTEITVRVSFAAGSDRPAHVVINRQDRERRP
jgi:hypothetical protein